MTISYGAPVHNSGKKMYKSRALETISHIHEDYQADDLDILTEDVNGLYRNALSFNEYKDKLLEGTDAATREQLDTLFENTRQVMIQESTISGSNPITALSLPMLRVGWPKMAVREGLPTEPVEQPSFKVTTKRPYVLGRDGEKLYLPAVLKDEAEYFGLPRLNPKGEFIDATAGTINNHDLLSPIGKSTQLGDEVDPRFTVTEVKVEFSAGEETHKVRIELDVNRNTLSGKVTSEDGSEVTDILGNLDRRHGLLNLTAIGEGTLVAAKIVGYVSSEANNDATQIGFDIEGIDCVIGTAQPVESPINIQNMTDLSNMYNVDSTLSHLETMTTFIAQNTDKEGVSFIDEVFELDVPADRKIIEKFSVTPPQNFVHGESEWRDQIRLKIDRIVSRMQTEVDIYSGHAVMFCHPLDAQVISNVKWQFVTSEQVNDVEVTYRVGTYTSGTSSYIVLQSPYFSQGRVRIVYVPSDEQHKTLVYYPYAFHTMRGMVSSSPNAANLPSIQMIKRHLYKAFTPMVAMLEIEDNEIK